MATIIRKTLLAAYALSAPTAATLLWLLCVGAKVYKPQLSFLYGACLIAVLVSIAIATFRLIDGTPAMRGVMTGIYVIFGAPVMGFFGLDLLFLLGQA